MLMVNICLTAKGNRTGAVKTDLKTLAFCNQR